MEYNITLLDAILEVIELYPVYPCIVIKAHYSKCILLWLPETLPHPSMLGYKGNLHFPEAGKLTRTGRTKTHKRFLGFISS